MDLLAHMNIRKRRSQRLSGKCPESPKRECLEPVPHGDFEKLPLEISYKVFSYLSMLDLSKFCLASKAILEFVESYRQTKWGDETFLVTRNVHSQVRTESWPSDIIHSFFILGLYMKRSSFLKSTSKRLKHISTYLNKQLLCAENCGDGRRCISFYCYGTFLHTVIAGWDDHECYRVLEYIHQNTPITKHINQILLCQPELDSGINMFHFGPIDQYTVKCIEDIKHVAGSLSHLEVYVRCFYRRAFIDVLRKKEDKAFWLYQILKPYPLVHQARLLQILFLLKSNVGVNFNTTVRDRLDIAALSDLGNALVLLADHGSWSDDNIISVIDEIIAIPSTWHPQNVAALLINCGDKVILKVLTSKAINNRFTEVVCLAHHLIVVCVKAFQSIKRAMECLWTFLDTLKVSERKYVLTELMATFKDAIYEHIDLEAEVTRELDAILEGLVQFTHNVLDLALESLKDNKTPKSNFTQITKTVAIMYNTNTSINEE